jgi:hypothetical protein
MAPKSFTSNSKRTEAIDETRLRHLAYAAHATPMLDYIESCLRNLPAANPLGAALHHRERLNTVNKADFRRGEAAAAQTTTANGPPQPQQNQINLALNTFLLYRKRWAIVDKEDFRKVETAAVQTITICGLLPRELLQQKDEKKLAVASLLLATALVKNPGLHQLSHLYQRLKNQDVNSTRKKLVHLFLEDDIYTPKKFPQLIMKGFARSKQDVQYIDRLCLAFAEAREVLRRVHSGFIDPILSDRPVAPKVEQAFRKYFGDLHAKIDVSTIKFRGAKVPGQVEEHGFLAAQSLNRIFKRVYLDSEQVIFYYGSPNLSPIFAACTFFNPNKIEIDVNDLIFKEAHHSYIVNIILHEFTHSCFATFDHRYGYERCQHLSSSPGEALANADNYAFFMSDAFQFGWERGPLNLRWGRTHVLTRGKR